MICSDFFVCLAVSELSEIRGTPYPDAASTPVFGNRTTTNGRTASLKNQKEAVNDDTQFAKSHNQKKDGADERSGSSSSRGSWAVPITLLL